MSVDSTNFVSAAGDNWADMFIATMNELPEIGDEISEYIPLFDYLKKKNLIKKKAGIGQQIPIVVMDKDNPTIQWVSGYDDAISKPADVLTEGTAQYGHLTGRMMTNREEQIKNSGDTQLIDLIERKREQLRIGLVNELEDGLMSTDEANGKKITGLGRIMDESVAVHGISPATYTYWVPTRTYKTGTTAFALATEFRDGMRKLFRQVRTAPSVSGPDVCLMGEDVWDAHLEWAEGKIQVTAEQAQKIPVNIMGDVMIEVMGRTYIYSEDLAAKEMWALNFRDGIEVRAHSGTWFHTTPWENLEGKVQTKYSDNLTYLSLFCKNRKANGRIVFS